MAGRPGPSASRRARAGAEPGVGRPGSRGSRAGVGWRAAATGADDPADGTGGSTGGPPADPESVARLICLRLLTAAPRTRAQLADTLRRRNVPDDAAEAVLSRFTEVGLIDDAMFAAAWVESRHHGRGLGRRALAAELERRGVERGEIEAAVGRLSPETELATARDLVRRRLPATRGQPAPARIRRLVGMLARKGYPAGLAFRVVREALDREREASDELGDYDTEPSDTEPSDTEMAEAEMSEAEMSEAEMSEADAFDA
ncbi:MAG: regulatory protein RecX [Streptosporangiaceae bacterium]